MREEIVKVYNFGELSPEAKEAARSWYRQDPDIWGWADEWWQSALAFSKLWPVDIYEADYDLRRANIRYHGPDIVGHEAVAEWLAENNYFGSADMTGYYGDYPFYDPQPEPYETLKEFFYQAVQQWVRAAANDLEHCYSDEAVDEALEINSYEFRENGNVWH